MINAAVFISRMSQPARIPRLSYVNGAFGRGERVVGFYGERPGVRPFTAQVTDAGRSSKASNGLVTTFQGALSWQARPRNYTTRMKSNVQARSLEDQSQPARQEMEILAKGGHVRIFQGTI
jgi:hypothetical protein